MIKKTTLTVIGLILFFGTSPLLHAQQFARPDSTVAAGTFTAVNAGTLHDALNEVSFDDNDYIDSGVGNVSTVILGLSNVSDPGTYANNHIIRYRCQATVGAKPKGGEGCDVALYQGGSLIASSNGNASRGSFSTLTYTIPDASGITDYTLLELRISSSSVDSDESIQISWAELEVPGAAAVPPTVDSPPTSASVTDTTATLGGNVSADGGAAVTDRGVEWGPSSSTQGNYPNSQSSGSGGLGSFTVPVSGLSPSTPYYFRAWAINSAGQSWSDEGTFSTAPAALPPTVAASAASAVTASTATLNGNVTDDGGATVTDRGVEWGIALGGPYPNSQSAGSGGLGSFSVPVTGLSGNTRYYFRAWATNSASTEYSGELFFDTPIGEPTLGPPTVGNIAETSADLGGEVTDTGGGTVSACGVYWDTASPPETAGMQVPMSPCDSPFSQNVTGLPNEVLVYYRAYAINEAGTAYSTIDSFTPSVPKTPPVIDPTPTVTNITHQSADLGGNVTSAGGLPIERGTVWNETGNPGIGDNKLAEGGTTAGAFSHTRTLPPGKDIYFKAYATNSQGTVLSNTLMFTTDTEPTVQASNVAFSKTSARGMRIIWTRGNGEGALVVVRETGTPRVDPVDGVSYAANHFFPDAAEIGSSGNFVVYAGSYSYVNVGMMTANTSYEVAVYEYTSSSGNWDYLQANPATGSNSTTNQPVHNTDVGAACGDCHDAHFAFLPHDAEQKTVCETCHNPSGDASAKLEFDLHLTPNKNPDLDYVDCGFCHELHNHVDENTTYARNAITSSWNYNKSYLRANVGKYVSTAADVFELLDDGAFLHNDTYDAADAANALTPERAVEGGDDTTARGYCQVCHTYTKYHRSSFTTVADRPNPGDPLPNQCHDGEGGSGGPGDCESGNPEINCGRCHQHNNRFIGVGGSQTCIDCHSGPQGIRPTITAQFDRLSTHVTGGAAAVTPEDCLVCHDFNTHTTQKVTVWDLDDGVTSFPQATAGQPTTNTGEGEAFAPHCLSCHDDGLASSLPASGSDQTQASPFTGSGAPPVIDETAWANAGHNRDSVTFPTNPVSCVGNGTNGCHGSGHGSENLDLLAPAPGPNQTKTDFCYVCHDADGPSSHNILAQFNTATNFQATSVSTAKVNQRHDISAADQAYSGGVVSCANCHSPHVDNATNPVQDPDTGLPLATYSPASSYTDDGHNFAYDSGGNSDPINPEGSAGGFSEPDYIQFCLTCHDGTVPAGVTMSGGMVNMAVAWGSDDQHGNQDGSTGSKTSKGGLKSPWVTAADDAVDNDPVNNYAAMNCNTCHGAHGSPSIFNLRESITVAGQVMTVGGVGNLNEAQYNGSTTYTLPEIGGVQTDHYWGAWCTFCHKMDAHPGKVEADACTGGHMHGGGAF